MKTFNMDVNKMPTNTIGFGGENDVTEVVLDFTAWAEEFGQGAISLLVKRAMDTDPYPAVLITEGTTARWIITDVETSYKGHGEAQWIYTVGEQIKKSAVFGFNVDRSLNSPTIDTPEAYQTWVDDMIALGAGVAEIAEQVYEATGHYPKVENGYWYVWSVVNEEWVNTNQKAQGEQGIPGVGISSTVLNADYTLTITFTDGSSYTTPPIRGEKGDTGNGISSTVLNADYTLTITFTNGTTYTTPSIRGVPGQDYVITSADYDEIAGRVDTMIATERQQALDDINGAKTDAVSVVTLEGTTQKGLVTSEGTTQVGLVTAKGQEVIQSIPADYSELSDDVSELKSDLTHKEDWIVGNAEQLLSDNYTEDSEPYVFRKSVSGDREFDEIVGGTIAWNQIIQNGNFADGSTGWVPYQSAYGSLSAQDGELTYTILQLSNGNYQQSCIPNRNDYHAGHVYLQMYSIYVDKSCQVLQSYIDGAVGTIASVGWNNIAGIVTRQVESANARTYFGIVKAEDNGWAVNDTYKIKNVMIFDLTQMFGSTVANYIASLETATAGAGVALFRSLFPKPYYEYNAGELKSITGLVSHDTVGFNQWDEEWEVGAYDGSGNKVVNANAIRSVNKFPIFPNTEYHLYVGGGVSSSARFCYYDADEVFISSETISFNSSTTTPNNARYLAFNCGGSYGNTYNHDVCINISDPTKNGTYEPYVKRSYPLDSSLTLRGIPKLANNKMYFDGDTYKSDGTVTRRYGIVDLGTLNYQASSGAWLTAIPGKKQGSYNLFCLKYTASTQAYVANMNDKEMVGSASNNYAWFKDTAIESASDFKASVDGTLLLFELETPTTETAEPFQSLQICSEYGTEEYVYDPEAFPVPVGHVTKYPDNLRKKLDGLPWDLSMIAPIETGTKASQAYAVGKYFLLNNQFCKAKTAIASGATFTLNTNYEVTTIADELYTALHS